MNRREAIAALVSLPHVARISAAPVKTDDVIVVECDAHLSHEQRVYIKHTLGAVFVDRPVVVLDKGLTLKVVGK